jgi:hypothetical protein
MSWNFFRILLLLQQSRDVPCSEGRETRCWATRQTLPDRPWSEIEPGLQRRSPKNGNIWISVRRLSAIWTRKAPNLEPGEWPMDRKIPPLAGFSLVFSRNFPKSQTAWLATQWDSNPSPSKFPANREFYREFCDFGSLWADLEVRNRCTAVTFRTIPYGNYQGKYLG